MIDKVIFNNYNDVIDYCSLFPNNQLIIIPMYKTQWMIIKSPKILWDDEDINDYLIMFGDLIK